MEIMKKKGINRSDFDSNILHLHKRPPLSNGLQSDLETRAVYIHSTCCKLRSYIVASCLEPSVDMRERI